MSFLKNIFAGKETPVTSYADFWAWFLKNEKAFFNVVKNKKDFEKDFFDKLSPKLEQLHEGYLFLTGMWDDNTVELIFTTDGNIKNIVFVEELVNAAPEINGWRFTALKPAMDIKDFTIEMGGYSFSEQTLNFYAAESGEYPDKIDIAVVCEDMNEEDNAQIRNGVYIFLDNYLGELEFADNIDNITVIGKEEAQKDLVPIGKLKDFLAWRKKEFVEKYDGIRYDTENDEYSMLEAELEDGSILLAVIDRDLLTWDRKPSHPWIAVLTINYDGRNNNGMPDTKDYETLNNIEEEIMRELKDFEGYLNIGRQTTGGEREIYFACKDYRKPSKVFSKICRTHADNFEIGYDIYKDKYWESFERFS